MNLKQQYLQKRLSDILVHIPDFSGYNIAVLTCHPPKKWILYHLYHTSPEVTEMCKDLWSRQYGNSHMDLHIDCDFQILNNSFQESGNTYIYIGIDRKIPNASKLNSMCSTLFTHPIYSYYYSSILTGTT